MSNRLMTIQDQAIRASLAVKVNLIPDTIDFRAMMAREVLREREWRIHGEVVTPAMCAEYDAENGRNVREYVEAINGEALA